MIQIMGLKTGFSRRSTGVLLLLFSLRQTRLGKTQQILPSSRGSPGCRGILPRKSISPSQPLSGRAKPWGCKKGQDRCQIPTFPHRALPTSPHIFGKRARVQCHRIWNHPRWQTRLPRIVEGTPTMAHCRLAKQCAFFVVREEGKEMREYFTGLYCYGKFRDCARYRAALKMGQKKVPDDMFPNEDAFLSLFAWPGNRQKTLVNKRSRSGHPDTQPVSPPEKNAAASGRLPPTRQTRSQR